MANKKSNARGLGRGIEALFEEIAQENNGQKEEVIELELSQIRPNPYQPRKIFDEDALKELAASISKNGVFQPIIVRKSSVQGYDIIAGERRYRASQLANKEVIPAIVRELDEEAMMEIAVLENLQREDLTPLEEAQAYSQLMENLHLTQAQVSERLGKSRPYVANCVRLLGLPAQVKQMIQEKALSMGQARTLLSLKDKKKIIEVAKKTVKENLTVRQLEQLVAKLNEQTKKPLKKEKLQSPYFKQSEQLLGEKFGTKVAIKNNTSGKGKIEIDYLSLDDLNRILEILNISLD